MGHPLLPCPTPASLCSFHRRLVRSCRGVSFFLVPMFYVPGFRSQQRAFFFPARFRLLFGCQRSSAGSPGIFFARTGFARARSSTRARFIPAAVCAILSSALPPHHRVSLHDHGCFSASRFRLTIVVDSLHRASTSRSRFRHSNAHLPAIACRETHSVDRDHFFLHEYREAHPAA